MTFSSCLRTAFVALISASTITVAQAQQVYDEYTESKNLAQINAADAYTQGFTGQGVTIGVIDTGIDLTHPDLSAQGKFVGGIKFNDAYNLPFNSVADFTAMTAGAKNDSDP